MKILDINGKESTKKSRKEWALKISKERIIDFYEDILSQIK